MYNIGTTVGQYCPTVNVRTIIVQYWNYNCTIIVTVNIITVVEQYCPTVNVETIVGQYCNCKYCNYNCTIIVSVNIVTVVEQCCNYNVQHWNYSWSMMQL
ncbi:MAG: hypothetical protein QW478_01345 [Candidatus Micrarchaeaceae archaeon]